MELERGKASTKLTYKRRGWTIQHINFLNDPKWITLISKMKPNGTGFFVFKMSPLPLEEALPAAEAKVNELCRKTSST